jgi:hypothetical protein
MLRVIKHRDIKTGGGVEIYFHGFLTSALGGNQLGQLYVPVLYPH